jgi:hypothetical protein
MRICLSILFFLCLIHFEVVAQQKKFTPDEEALKKHVIAFGDAYSSFGKSKDKEKVMTYMDKEVIATLITTDINNKVTSFDSDLAGFDNHLKSILLKDGLQINYKVTNIPRAYVSGDVGVVVYEASYKQEQNKEVWSSGDETVALTLKKDRENQWKIIHYTTIAFENTKLKGQCFCAVAELEGATNTTKQYQTATTAPAGKSYATFSHDFKFTIKEQQDRVIEVTQKIDKQTPIKVGKKTEFKTETIIENYTFYLTFAGELYLLKGKKPITGEIVDTDIPKKENAVAVAPNKEEAMMQIIQKYLMPTTCTSIKYKQ